MNKTLLFGNPTPHYFNREFYKKSAEDFKYSSPSYPKNRNSAKHSTLDFSWLKYFAYLIVFAAIIFLIYNVITYFMIPSNKKISNNELSFTVSQEEPTIASDLDVLLQNAIDKNDLREAIRIYYLLGIRELDKKKIIKFGIDKTNFEYLSEMGSHPSFDLFRQMTFFFERIWFGDALIDIDNYSNYKNNYDELTSLINNSPLNPKAE